MRQVGAHRDLLAYLVRRLLENGANSLSLIKLSMRASPPSEVAADPFAKLVAGTENLAVIAPSELYGVERRNSKVGTCMIKMTFWI